jgi:hypothetical protein
MVKNPKRPFLTNPDGRLHPGELAEEGTAFTAPSPTSGTTPVRNINASNSTLMTQLSSSISSVIKA